MAPTVETLLQQLIEFYDLQQDVQVLLHNLSMCELYTQVHGTKLNDDQMEILVECLALVESQWTPETLGLDSLDSVCVLRHRLGIEDKVLRVRGLFPELRRSKTANWAKEGF